jgi:hypothetical protein
MEISEGTAPTGFNARKKPIPKFSKISILSSLRTSIEPRRRTPLAKAKATGQDKNHASRFKDHREPQSKRPLGKPPKWMVRKHQLEAWQTFSDEVPWLNHSHRALVGIASEIRGRLIAGEEVSVNGLNLLRLCLGQMDATPVDSSKITLPEDKDDADPSDKYFS